MEQHSPQPFDLDQFNYSEFFPPEMQQQVREGQKADHIKAMLAYTAEMYPDIPEVSYKAFFLTEAINAEATHQLDTHRPNVYVPIINTAYQKLRSEGQAPNIEQVQFMAAKMLLEKAEQAVSEPQQRRDDYLGMLTYFINSIRYSFIVQHNGKLNLDITRQLLDTTRQL